MKVDLIHLEEILNTSLYSNYGCATSPGSPFLPQKFLEVCKFFLNRIKSVSSLLSPMSLSELL